MNWKKSGIFKITLALTFCFLGVILYADSLEMYLDQIRFLDEQGNTIYNFVYKIPNSKLEFIKEGDNYLATVDALIYVRRDGEKTIIQEFSHNIGARDLNSTKSDNYYYLDKISLTLAQAGFKLGIEFTDVNSKKVYVWENMLVNLSPDSIISDLEFSHNIVSDELPHMQKFKRGNKTFYVDPSHIFDKGQHNMIYIYYEIQNLLTDASGYASINEVFTLSSRDDTIDFTRQLQGEGNVFDMIKEIPISEIEPGYYSLRLELTDEITGDNEVRESFVVIVDEVTRGLRLFTDKEEEFRLIRYFLSPQRARTWDNLSEEGKLNFIYRFWAANDPNPVSTRNEFFEEVQKRVDFANTQYSHHLDGWRTDKGRIHIRHGEPTEIESGYTDIDTRLGTKDYKIWKYRHLGSVYLFVDLQGNGNYRLIFVRNDDLEQTYHDWQRYVGTDFDMSKLE